MSAELTILSLRHQLVLAGLVRLMVRLDGRFSRDERAALSRMGLRLGERAEADSPGPYRAGSAVQPLGPDRFWQLIEEAGRVFVDETSIKAAARGLDDRVAREEIFALLYEVATAELITTEERELLDWLESTWGLSA